MITLQLWSQHFLLEPNGCIFTQCKSRQCTSKLVLAFLPRSWPIKITFFLCFLFCTFVEVGVKVYVTFWKHYCSSHPPLFIPEISFSSHSEVAVDLCFWQNVDFVWNQFEKSCPQNKSSKLARKHTTLQQCFIQIWYLPNDQVYG